MVMVASIEEWEMENKITEKDEKVRIKKNCKGYLAFQAPKCIASRNAIVKYCKFFCNSATMQF